MMSARRTNAGADQRVVFTDFVHHCSDVSARSRPDRMLVWHAIREDLLLVSRDQVMAAYELCGLTLVW